MKGILIIALFNLAFSVYPIALIHGIKEACNAPNYVRLQKEFSERLKTPCVCLETGAGTASIFRNILYQGKIGCDMLRNNPIFHGDFSMVAISQGVVIARYLIEKCEMPGKVKRFVSWSGPNQGISKIPNCSSGPFCDIINKIVQRFTYIPIFQEIIAPTNYIRANHNLDGYLKGSYLLPDLNNERNFDPQIKVRMGYLEKVSVIMSNQDTVIFPKESEWFGILDENDKLISLNDTDLYKKDLIGLKALMDQGRVDFHKAAGGHYWLTPDEENRFVYPYLQ